MKPSQDAIPPTPKQRRKRNLKLGLLLAAVAVLGVCGGFAWSICNTVGGFQTLLAVYRSWRDPGSVAFAGKPIAPARPVAGPSVVAANPASAPVAANPANAPVDPFWAKWTAIFDKTAAARQQAFDDLSRMNILCLGVDYNHDRYGVLYTKHVRTDTMFVVSLDRNAQGLRIVSIPRDMRVMIPGYGLDKINAAFSYTADGARALTVKTVEKFLGIHIDHTVIIKPYAAEHLIDAIGGIDLRVEKNMNYDDNWGGLHIHLKKGYQHLNGRQAVGYIRFRHDEEGDFGRIRRQQQVVNTLLTQLKRVESLTRIGNIKWAFQHDIQTTLTYDQLIDLAMLYKNFDRHKMVAATIAGTDQLINDVYYLVVDEKQKRHVINELLRVHNAMPATAASGESTESSMAGP